MGKRDRDREQHIALAIARATKAGANIPASINNAIIDYERTMKVQAKKDRRTKRLDDLLDEPCCESFAQAMIDMEHAKIRVYKMMHKRKGRELAVVNLHAMEGMTFADVGESLKISASRAYQLYHRAIGRLGGDAKATRAVRKR